MRRHMSLWLTLVVGVSLIPVAIATESGWPAVIAAIFIAASLIGFAYSAGEGDPSAAVLRWARRHGAGRRR
jgi:hypothetical protein